MFQIREGSQVKIPRKLTIWPENINGKLEKMWGDPHLLTHQNTSLAPYPPKLFGTLSNPGGTIVIWSRPLYIQEAHLQLPGGRFCEHLKSHPLKEYQKKVKSTINDMILKNKLPPSPKNLSHHTTHFSFLHASKNSQAQQPRKTDWVGM